MVTSLRLLSGLRSWTVKTQKKCLVSAHLISTVKLVGSVILETAFPELLGWKPNRYSYLPPFVYSIYSRMPLYNI